MLQHFPNLYIGITGPYIPTFLPSVICNGHPPARVYLLDPY